MMERKRKRKSREKMCEENVFSWDDLPFFVCFYCVYFVFVFFFLSHLMQYHKDLFKPKSNIIFISSTAQYS